MRVILGSATAALALAACASKPPGPVAQCPAISQASWQSAGDAAVDKVFGAELRRRFGSLGVHLLAEQSTDASGNLTVTYRRIGPMKFAMPEPGKGGELQFLLERCTAKVLRTRKLAELEAAPRPIPPAESEP